MKARVILVIVVLTSVAHAEPIATTKPTTAATSYKRADPARPRPSIVRPPTPSTPDSPSQPPSDAVVLFDGKDLSAWMEWNPRGPSDPAKPAKWIIQNGYAKEFGNQIQTRQTFGDSHFHIEWAIPSDAAGVGQKRGNSGVEIGDHGEIQILDSFNNDTYPDGQAAAIYGVYPPLVNACRKQGEWQTYDIFYVAPRFESGKKVKSATYTILHNGLPVHHNVEVRGDEVESRLRFRPHGGKVHYRNIWVRPLHQYDENAGKPTPTTTPAAKAGEHDSP